MKRSLININFSKDRNYRYKMEDPVVTIQGSGVKNKRTIFENAEPIAQKLGFEADDIIRYLSQHLNCNYKTNHEDHVYELMTHVKYHEICVHLKAFIEKFVLCRECKLPELNTEVFFKSNKQQNNNDASSSNYDSTQEGQTPSKPVVKSKDQPVKEGLRCQCKSCSAQYVIKISEDTKFISYLIKKKQRSEEEMKKKANPMSLVTNMVKFMETNKDAKYDDMKTQLLNVINDPKAQYQTPLEEIPGILLATFFRETPPDKQEQWEKVLRIIGDIDIVEPQYYINYLYSLELLVKRYESIFDAQPTLLAAILQQSSFLTQDVLDMYQSDNAVPFVPDNFHQKCLLLAQPYIEWFEGDNGEEGEDAEEAE